MRLTRAIVKSFLPKRPKDANKGSFGRVLIVAGSQNMAGAGVLCARAALQAGAGLTCLALPKSRQCVAAAALPETLTLPLPEKDGKISARAVPALLRFMAGFHPSVLLVGPGLADAPFIIPFLKKSACPAVLDADALNALAREKDFGRVLGGRFPVICTPHPGEMRRLLDKPVCADPGVRAEYARELSRRTGGVTLLKGKNTVITDGQTVYVNPTGGPALAKAGSGDTLAGIIAGLWAQLTPSASDAEHTALKAAAAGAYLHGLSADLAARELTDRCVLASDVSGALPRAFKRVLRAK